MKLFFDYLQGIIWIYLMIEDINSLFLCLILDVQTKDSLIFCLDAVECIIR